MNRNPKLFLEHIQESIALIDEYLRDVTREQFLQSVRIQDMVIRRLEIIGEAVKNLPDDLKRKYPNVPWKRIAGMRDKLIHGYFGVDLNLTWRVSRETSPLLKDRFMKFCKKLQHQEMIPMASVSNVVRPLRCILK